MIDGNRAKALHELSEHRGWQELKEIYDDTLRKWQRHVATDFLRNGAEVDQREIDYQRGYMDAWQTILAQPDQAEKRFEKALRRREETS